MTVSRRIVRLAGSVLPLAFAACAEVDPYVGAVPSPAYVPPPVPYVEAPAYPPGTAFVDPRPAYGNAPSPGYRYPAPAFVAPSPYATPYVPAGPGYASVPPAPVPPGYGPPGVVTVYPGRPDRTGYCAESLANAAEASNRAAATGDAFDAARAQRTEAFHRRDC